MRLIVATRKSPLALAQCRAWTSRLVASGIDVEELHVTTTGDRIQDRSLSEVGGKGLFTKEIEEALLACRADFAVHSFKDVPAAIPPGLCLGSVSEREDPRDAVITRSAQPLASLAAGSRIGTSSLRRISQLRAWRPDLHFAPLRGNVETRIARCQEGVVDAVVLALAGLTRLGLAARATEVLDPEVCLPAVAQGALVAEHRAGDERVAEALQALDDLATRLQAAAERGVMKAVEGNCQVPVGAFAVHQGGQLWLRAFLARGDGSHAQRVELKAPWPGSPEAAERLGWELGQELRARVAG